MTPLNIKTEKVIDYKQKRQRLQAEKTKITSRKSPEEKINSPGLLYCFYWELTSIAVFYI